jgi:catechol 2,3-dioxygenase-like lactoylglutathione lyase family enzyme
MLINHICIMVSDLERSLRFYRDLLGFENIMFDSNEPGIMFDAPTIDAILGAKRAKTRVVILTDEHGTVLEIQQASNPHTTKTPDKYLRYGWTGITELALTAPDIDDLWRKVTEAGIETQTSFMWAPQPAVRSFLFYDPDGALIQAVGIDS